MESPSPYLDRSVQVKFGGGLYPLPYPAADLACDRVSDFLHPEETRAVATGVAADFAAWIEEFLTQR